MPALALSLGIFLGFLILGLGVTALLPPKYSSDVRMRVAPAVGMGLYLVFAIPLSRLGLPVKVFVYPLTAVLLLASAVTVARRPPLLSKREVIGFVAPLVVAITLVGSPMLIFGFHWLSYANGDMANYSLGAQRLVDHAYFAPPPVSAAAENRDAGQMLWALPALGGERLGAEMVLASVAGAVHHEAFEVFMPTIFAAFLALVVGAGALAIPTGGTLVPTMVSLLVAAAPLTGFGVFLQVLAQEFGLPSLAAVCALLIGAPDRYGRGRDLFRTAIVAGVAVCALLALYPELLPFAILATLFHLGARAYALEVRPVAISLGITAVVALVLLNAQAITMLELVYERVSASSAEGIASIYLFPEYLLPSGIVNLWGLQPIASFYADPIQSLLIVAAIALTLATIIAAFILMYKSDTPAAPVLCAMLLVAIAAARGLEAFALYKLAMYVQPFMIAVGISALSAVTLGLRRRTLRQVAVAGSAFALLVAGLPAQATYLAASSDASNGAKFTEIPGASRDNLIGQLRALAAGHPNETLVSDAPMAVSAELEAGYFTRNSILFATHDFLAENAFFVRAITPGNSHYLPPNTQLGAEARILFAAHNAQFVSASFPFGMANGSPHARMKIDRRIAKDLPHPYLLLSNRGNILNRYGQPDDNADITIEKWTSGVELLFAETSLGSEYGVDDTISRVAMYKAEADYFFPGKKMQGIGRYLLFELLGKRGPVRIILDMTTSLNGDHLNRLPAVAAVGTRRVSFHALGNGSGRLISDPVTPRVIQGISFVGIDMGTDGTFFPEHRSGLMLLYGRDVPTDARQLVGFARDISAVLPTSHFSEHAPSALTRFPQDLENQELFYSGLYEDGWIGEDSRVRLMAPKNTSYLHLVFSVPHISDSNFSSSVTLSVDGRECGVWPSPLGRSVIETPISVSSGTHEIELHFSRHQELPGRDGRAVAAKLEYLGFQ